MELIRISKLWLGLKVTMLSALTVGCAVTYDQPADLVSELPESWVQQAEAESIKENWLSEFGDATLEELVAEAMAANIELAAQSALVDEARYNAKIAGADRWPSLDLSLSNTLAADPDVDSSNLVLSSDWELDIWGRLSANQQQSVQTFLGREAAFEQSRRDLAANVARGWYQLINDQSLYKLIEQRVVALQSDLEIIESSYSQGIADALDVYLARTSLLQELASAETQRQTVVESTASLQRLLGRYPSGEWLVEESLPTVEHKIPAGVPSGLIARRPDLQQNWHNLLSADARLAVAHKNRFPRLSLTGRIADSDEDLSEVFDADELVKSLIGNIALPLFQGGQLLASEKAAAALREQAEKNYLSAVQNAFLEVETAISRQSQLAKRFDAIQGAQQSAEAGYELSIDQYRRGLVDYATVLQAQLRAFSTETSLLVLQNQLLQNRIALYQALGGDYAANESN